MKILVFSDSHGNTSRMIDAIEAHLPSCKLIIHLGDGVRDISYVSDLYPQIPVISLKGNGESFSRDVRIIEEFGVKMMCIHGHTYGVKSCIDRAAMCAIDEGVDILLYGHTHTAADTLFESVDGRRVKIFNPGSVGKGYPPAYGIISFDRLGRFLTSHGYF